MKLTALQQQKDSIIEIAKHYRAINVRVFGSVVRGEENENSDINLLVDFLPNATLIDHVGLIQTVSEKLGQKVDIVSEKSLNIYLRHRIFQEAITL